MGVKWGILGTAGIAAECTIPGMKQAENCELYAIAGRNEKKALEFQERYGFKKAYVGYDALLAEACVHQGSRRVHGGRRGHDDSRHYAVQKWTARII